MSRTCRRGVALCVLAMLAATFLAASTPRADAAIVEWTGAGSADNWSLGANWIAGAVPTSPVDEMVFPDLGSPCDDAVLGTGSSGDSCYSVLDDAGTVDVGEFEVDNEWPYTIAPQDASDTLELTATNGNDGLLATPMEGPQGSFPPGPAAPTISVPVTLVNSQDWGVVGGPGDQYGLEVDDVSGSSSALTLSLLGPLYTTSLSTGPLTISGAAPLVVELNATNPADQPALPAAGTTLYNSSDLTVAAPSTTSGPLLAYSVNNINLEGPTAISIGDGAAPDGTLDVSGGVDLENSHGQTLGFYIDGSASNGSTPTPSTDYAQLTASGTVALGGAALHLTLGSDGRGDCEDLVPGQVYTLVSAATISGELEDDVTYQPLTDGEVVALENECDSTAGPTVRINYNTSATPETVTATVVSAGNAGDVPMLTGSTPQISGVVPGTSYEGLQLQANSGGWSGNPTRYDYTWYSCTPAQGTDCDSTVGDDAATYTPTSGDVGNTIEVCVDATNGYGSNPNQYCSDPTTAVAVPPAPELTQGAVSLKGNDQLGDTLTVEPGSWSWFPDFAYQWQRCGTQGDSCSNVVGATGETYTLSSADVGQFVRAGVTATDAGGSTVAYSGIFGQVQGQPAQAAAGTSASQIQTLLSAIPHASGKRAIAALIRSRVFASTFHAPGAGSIRVIWKTTVTRRKRNHRTREQVTVASGSGQIDGPGVVALKIRLTRAGKLVLRAHPSGLMVTATEEFRPAGGIWTVVTKRFRL
jgi:hypothetical protein